MFVNIIDRLLSRLLVCVERRFDLMISKAENDRSAVALVIICSGTSDTRFQRWDKPRGRRNSRRLMHYQEHVQLVTYRVLLRYRLVPGVAFGEFSEFYHLLREYTFV